jgi:hypothetical protein
VTFQRRLLQTSPHANSKLYISDVCGRSFHSAIIIQILPRPVVETRYRGIRKIFRFGGELT